MIRWIRKWKWTAIAFGLFWTFSAEAQNLDIDLLRRINLHRPERLDHFFIDLDQVATPISVAVPFGLLGAGLFTHDSLATWQGIQGVVGIGIATVVTEGLKYAVNRPRPYITYPFIHNLVTESSPSFPSGSASVSFSMATSLSLDCPRWYVIVPSFLWAGLVGYSRLDMGIHYPSDVLAGALVGTASSWLSWKAGKWLNKKRVRRHEQHGE